MVDEDDRVVEVVSRARIRRENLRHRSVGIVVRDSEQRVLVHRRADTKDVWPGRWDLAVGGVVSSGETYDRAAVRELAEEVGITVALVPLGAARYEDDDVRALVRCYTAVHDGEVTFPDGEVAEARWVTATELRRLLASESFVPDSLALFPELLPELFAGP